MKNNNYDILNEFIKIEQFQIEQLNLYFEHLKESNSNYNLTTIIKFEDVVLKHYYDSLIFTKEIDLTDQKIIDVGSGAGFPGIVLKIFFPDLSIFLLESNRKKANFLNEIIVKLRLKNIFVINDRCENIVKTKRENFDIVVSRAMAPLNILLELTAQLVRKNGILIALKGKKFQEELRDLNNENTLLGLEMWKTQNIFVEGIGDRANIFYRKINSTPKIFPRSFAAIKKKPLGGEDKNLWEK